MKTTIFTPSHKQSILTSMVRERTTQTQKYINSILLSFQQNKHKINIGKFANQLPTTIKKRTQN